nr:hypothetical protein K-LCC10_0471 [Kaumoebavirus]
MKRIFYEKNVKEGDIVLVGNDDIEVKAFSQVLEMCDYFKTNSTFIETKNKCYTFDQFNSEQLVRLVKYLCGVKPAQFNSATIEILDYFGAPLDNVKLGCGDIMEMNIEHIVSIFDKRPLESADFDVICEKIIDENLYEDAEILKWLEKIKEKNVIEADELRTYRKIRIAEYIIDGNAEDLVNNFYFDYGLSYIVESILEMFACSKMDTEYIANIIALLIARERKNEKDCQETPPDEERAARSRYINGILRDKGERKNK